MSKQTVNKLRIALVYDRVNKWGGAESVLLALHELYPEAPLYTSVYNPDKAPWAKVFSQVIPSFLQKIPVLRNYHELLGWLTPIAYEGFNFDGYDIVISVTSEAAKGIITKPSTLHMCYCLTPTRYLWSGYKEYLQNPPTKLSWIPFYNWVSQPFLKYVRYWDKIASARPDVYIAISTAVQKRIEKYYGRKSDIICPPVETDGFLSKGKGQDNSGAGSKYYLTGGRLVPYKKVDLVIETFNELGLPLVVVGKGSEERKLKLMAKKNVDLRGFVTDDELISLYKSAKAFIHPQDEDFGIMAVEAQAAGVPVIAYKKGGALDTVIDGKTGIFFEKQTVASLQNAVARFRTLQFDKSVLVKNAKRFSKKRFKKEFEKFVKMHENSYS